MPELHPRTREIITFFDGNRRLLEREVRAVQVHEVATELASR